MMKLNSNVACIEYKNKVILANKLTGMWLRITKEIYNYFIKALELNYERKDFVRSFMREEDQIYRKTARQNGRNRYSWRCGIFFPKKCCI